MNEHTAARAQPGADQSHGPCLARQLWYDRLTPKRHKTGPASEGASRTPLFRLGRQDRRTMSPTSLPYNLLVLAAALVSSCLGGYAATRSGRHDARIFALLMLAIAEWSFCYLFADYPPSPSARTCWLAAAYIGIAFAGPLWLLFALLNTSHSDALPRGALAGAGLLGSIGLIAALANGFTSMWVAVEGKNLTAEPGAHGPLFWIHTAI